MEPRLRHNLDELLKSKGLRASDLSKITGIPKQTLSEWRAGLVPKSIVSLKRVASAFDISLDALVFEAGLEGPNLVETEIKVKRLEQAVATLAAASPASFIVSKDDGLTQFVSESWTRTFGYPRERMVGRSWYETIASPDRDDISLRFAADQKNMICQETRMIAADLRMISCQIMRLPLHGERSLISFLPSDQAKLEL